MSNPATITECTESGIRSALVGGGHIIFSCGSSPVTISISTPLEFNSGVDTVLDGGGLITLDGGNSSRIFYKGWDSQNVENIQITLQNIRVVNGRAPSGDEHSGGAFYGGYQGLRLHIINSTFSNNQTVDITTADNQGGAIFIHNRSGTFEARACQ